MKHPLCKRYGLNEAEILDAIDRRFRLRVAVEGAVAEAQRAAAIEQGCISMEPRSGKAACDIDPSVAEISYSTSLGRAICGDSLDVMSREPSGSVDLVVTSPPYALHFKKEYGNADQADYVNWFLPFAREIKRLLKPDNARPSGMGLCSKDSRQGFRQVHLLALADCVPTHRQLARPAGIKTCSD